MLEHGRHRGAGRALDPRSDTPRPGGDVIDDGSADGTGDVVAGFGDKRVRYIRREKQGGSAAALNSGLAEARAPIIAVQDADDWSEPHRLERQLGVLTERPEVAVVSARMREIDHNGRERVPRAALVTGDVTDTLLIFDPLPHPVSTYRRDVVQALGGYDTRYRFAQDYDLWLRVAERHRLLMLDEVLGTRLMTPRNVAPSKERGQWRAVIMAQARSMIRRRSLRGLRGLLTSIAALATPITLKRILRRRRGQAV